MKKYILLFISLCILQSCHTTKDIDDQFVKREIRIFKRDGDDYRTRNVIRMFIILKMTNSVYEIYSEAPEGIIGKFSLRNDTLTLYHEYKLAFPDSAINMKRLNRKDTIPEFYPTKFIVKEDSLIDITNYYDFPEYVGGYSRPRENYVLVK